MDHTNKREGSQTEAIGPIIGMALLGILAGWFSGVLCRKALRLVVILVLVFIALQLIGYKIAVVHWDSLGVTSRSAAEAAADAAQAHKGVLWRLAIYNIPFTLGFIGGLWRFIVTWRRK